MPPTQLFSHSVDYADVLPDVVGAVRRAVAAVTVAGQIQGDQAHALQQPAQGREAAAVVEPAMEGQYGCPGRIAPLAGSDVEPVMGKAVFDGLHEHFLAGWQISVRRPLAP